MGASLLCGVGYYLFLYLYFSIDHQIKRCVKNFSHADMMP